MRPHRASQAGGPGRVGGSAATAPAAPPRRPRPAGPRPARPRPGPSACGCGRRSLPGARACGSAAAGACNVAEYKHKYCKESAKIGDFEMEHVSFVSALMQRAKSRRKTSCCFLDSLLRALARRKPLKTSRRTLDWKTGHTLLTS